VDLSLELLEAHISLVGGEGCAFLVAADGAVECLDVRLHCPASFDNCLGNERWSICFPVSLRDRLQAGCGSLGDVGF
jgi:hypothetical protein